MNKAKECIGCGATVVATLTDAQEQLTMFMQERLPKTEQKAPPLGEEMAIARTHPANYPSHVDVRSNLQRMPPAATVDADNRLSS